MAEQLSAAQLFAEATPQELAALSAVAFPRRLARGQILFTEGEHSDHLYLVTRGRLKVLVRSPHGEELLLTVVRAGESLGELSVLDERPRSATAQALERSDLLAIPAGAVRAVLADSPAITLAWAQDLALTLRRLTGSSADLVFLDLPRRLAKLLLAEGGDQVDLGLSQSELAARLGVARQTVNRALAALARRGWLAVDGSTIRLLDPRALARFAES